MQHQNKDTGEQEEVRKGALIALEGLLRENQSELRRILMEQNTLSPDSKADLSKELASKLEGLAWANKRELFKGDEAQQLNDLLREQSTKKTLADIQEKVARLMYHEALIPYNEFQLILQRCDSLERASYEITWKSPEAFWITRWDHASFANMHVAKKVERRIKTSDLPGERWKQLVDVLHSQGFAVSEYLSDILARFGKKTVLITSQTTSGKKVWKDITIRLCGEWKEEEISGELGQLWEAIEPNCKRQRKDKEQDPGQDSCFEGTFPREFLELLFTLGLEPTLSKLVQRASGSSFAGRCFNQLARAIAKKIILTRRPEHQAKLHS